MFEVILNSPWYTYLALPLFIFIARVVDVSMGTVRIVFISRGYKFWAPVLGFFEVLVWILVIRQIFDDLSNPITFIAYAGGFAMGTYAGMRIEEKFAVEKVSARVITHKDPTKLIKILKKENYKLTILSGEGPGGPVKVIFSVIDRKKLKEFVNVIHEFDSKAFYTVEDLRYAFDKNTYHSGKFHKFGFYRKGK